MNLTAAPIIFISLFLTTASSLKLLYKRQNWKQCALKIEKQGTVVVVVNMSVLT